MAKQPDIDVTVLDGKQLTRLVKLVAKIPTVTADRPTVNDLMKHQTQRAAHEIEQDRGADNLTGLIVEWCNARGPGHRFHLGEFTRDILNQQLCSPTSPYRILALLRKKNIVNYKVVNRAASFYELTPLDSSTADFFEGVQ